MFYRVEVEIQFAVKRVTKRVVANSPEEAKELAEKEVCKEIEADENAYTSKTVSCLSSYGMTEISN